MKQFLQFDISDFLNEMKEPLFLMDSTEILFFNRFFQESFKLPKDKWKDFFKQSDLISELNEYFDSGKIPESVIHIPLENFNSGKESYEWSFIPLPSSYSSRFLISKGIKVNPNRETSSNQNIEMEELAYLQSIISNGHDLIAILDEKGRYKYISESVSNKLGFTPDYILGSNYNDLVDRGIIELVKGDFKDALNSKKEIAIDFWLKKSNGERVYLESFAKNLLDHPQIQGILFSSRDITEFIETGKSLSKRYEIENLITQVSTLLINGNFSDLEDQFDLSLSKFGKFFGAKNGKISIINRETKELEIISFWEDEEKNSFPAPEGPKYFSLVNSIRKDLEKAKVKVLKNVLGLGRESENPSHFIFIPMAYEDRLMGIIQFEFLNTKIDLEEKELQILKQLGDIFAGAYLASLMTRKLERNESLLVSTEQLALSGSWRYSEFKNLFYFSGGFSKLLGLGEKERTMDFSTLIYKLDKETRQDFIQNLKKSSSEHCRTSGEFSMTDESGQVRYFSYEIEGRKEVFSKGVEVYGFCVDVTHKKNSENYLKLQSQILAQVADPIIVTGKDLGVIYLNEAAFQLCGLEDEKFFSGRLDELLEINWEDGENLNYVVKSLEFGKVWKKIHTMSTKKVSTSPYEISIQSIHSEINENIGYSFIFRGLAEKYRSEELAKRAQHIVENSPAVLFRVNPQDNYKLSYISQNISQFGYSADELIANGASFLDLVYLEDVEKIIQGSKSNQDLNDIVSFSGEYRIKKADGTLVWVEDKTKDVVGPAGKVILHEGIFQDISDRKSLEEVKSAKDHQYRMLASNIPDTNIFLVDEDRKYVLAEGTNFDKWGLKREDFEGKYLKDLQLTPYPQINAILDRVFHDGEVVESQFFLHGRYYQRIVRPIFEDGKVKFALSIVRDIHEEYKAKNDLLQSEEKYRRLVEESTEIIFSLSEAYLLHYVSPNVKQFLGYDSKEVMGRSIFDFIHLDDLGVFQQLLSENQNFLAENQFLEFRLRHKNGEYRVFNSNGKLIEDKDGIHRYYTGVARDISKLKEAQKELLIAKENAELASQVKSQFLSVMSHEIRTPMNAVIGLAHFLMEENPRPDQLENLKTLQFSAENLMALINDILDFNKIDSGKVELEMAHFEIRNLVHRTIHSHSFLAKEKGLKLSLLVDESIPQILIGDSLRLGQVVNNLLSNAIKFTEKGVVKVGLSCESIHQNNVEIKFQFEDSGIGIPEEKRKSIFEAFTQASSSTSRKYGGTGLGLAIVKRLVELFGGEIEVKARPGGGSIFEFSLVFEFLEEKKSHFDQYKEATFKSLGQSSILVAEDNSVNQILIKKFLTKWNVGNLVITGDGKEALESFNQGEFDIVLLDLQMPELDGFEVAKAIRNHAQVEKRNLPILALTAASLNEVKPELEGAGFNDYIPKPFSPEELYEKIIKFLHGKEKEFGEV
ncbi:PAS domain S-box protein [Algoriphagus mannitolivorans]|uniref:PAS domain S-box protein n=1 Tax=Algoriphagus mannitolivorans TaxID=226504 RepID=UPI000424B9F3|nr:PAS domain S-box protein [Algoriphagus mannitolivorans]